MKTILILIAFALVCFSEAVEVGPPHIIDMSLNIVTKTSYQLNKL